MDSDENLSQKYQALLREYEELQDHIAHLNRRHEEDLAWQQRAQQVEQENTKLKLKLNRLEKKIVHQICDEDAALLARLSKL